MAQSNTNIDSIIRSYLFGKQWPLHFYGQALKYALDCVRDLKFDVRLVVSPTSTILTVNDFHEVSIPDDYIDYIRFGRKAGKYIVPLVEYRGYNRLARTNSSGDQIDYATPEVDLESYPVLAIYYSWGGGVFVNDYFEPIGRYFGANSTPTTDFKVIPERGVITFGQTLSSGTEIYMEYISDTSSATSVVHPYAERCIEAYIDHEFMKWGKNRLGDMDRAYMAYKKEYRKLRARVNGLTKEKILQISRKRFAQGPKL